MADYEKVAKTAGIVLIGMIVSKGLSYLYRLIIARVGTEEYGLLSLALAIIGIIGIISLFGLNGGIIRYYSLFDAKKDIRRKKGTILAAIKISLFISIIIGLFLFIFSDWISITFFKDIRLSILLKILSFFLPFNVLREHFSSICISAQKAEYAVISKNVIENIIKVAVAFIFVFTAYKLIGAVVAVLIAVIFSFLFSFYFVEKKIFSIFSKIKPIYPTKEILNYSIPLFFGVLLIQVLVWVDVLMMGYFRTVEEVGIYSVALQTGTLMSIIPTAIIAIFVPLMTGYFVKKDTIEFRKLFKICTKWIFFINVPISFLIFFFSKEILGILFGKIYIVGYVALSILVVFYTLYQILITSTETLKSIGKSRMILINAAIAAPMNILLNYILIPKYGMVGGAIATGISMVCYSLLGFLECLYFTKIFVFDFQYTKSIFASIVGLLVLIISSKIIHFHEIVNIAILSTIFLFVYVLLIWILKGISVEEVDLFKKLKKRIVLKNGLKIF